MWRCTTNFTSIGFPGHSTIMSNNISRHVEAWDTMAQGKGITNVLPWVTEGVDNRHSITPLFERMHGHTYYSHHYPPHTLFNNSQACANVIRYIQETYIFATKRQLCRLLEYQLSLASTCI